MTYNKPNQVWLPIFPLNFNYDIDNLVTYEVLGTPFKITLIY